MNRIAVLASTAVLASWLPGAWGQAPPPPATAPTAAAAADLKECKLHNQALREALIREYNKTKKDNPYRLRSVFQTDFNHKDAEIQKLRTNKSMTIEECNRISARLHKQAELYGRELTRTNEEADKYDRVKNMLASVQRIQGEWKGQLATDPLRFACDGMLRGEEKAICMRRLPFVH